MATQPSEEQGNSDHAEQPADIDDVRVSIGSASSESGGAPEILEEEVERFYYRPLLRAAFKGDWESAKRFFERDSASKTAKITSRSETVLHIAASSAQDQFLENLVELYPENSEALEEVDSDGRTALHIAVLCGRIRMVKALVNKNPKLTQLPDNNERVPLDISALEAPMHREIAWFLAKKTTDDGPSHPFSRDIAIATIIDLSFAGHHDITLHLVGRYPHLLSMTSTRKIRSILGVLSSMESHFPSGTRLGVMEELIYKCIPVDLNDKPTNENSDPALQYLTKSLWNAAKIVAPIIKRMHEVKRKHVAAVELSKQVCIAISRENVTKITQFFKEDQPLYHATAKGISELMKLCFQFFPELIRPSSLDGTLTGAAIAAVSSRQERSLRLFLKVTSTNELSLVPTLTHRESGKMMHEAAKYQPHLHAGASVPGAAFRLQRELQWFNAVESWLHPLVRTEYYNGKRHWTTFVEQHKTLLENAEKWVKDTTNSCMLVSTLIATVLFAAAFTVPGGNGNITGVPLLLGEDSLLVFAISDALGLFSSVTAILLFLAILTSRYEPKDFLESLPKKIIMGLSLLFLSLAFMLVAFAATLTIVLDKRLAWVLIPITLLASLPVALFVVLQLPLLYQMFKSTYGRSIFRPESIWE